MEAGLPSAPASGQAQGPAQLHRRRRRRRKNKSSHAAAAPQQTPQGQQPPAAKPQVQNSSQNQPQGGGGGGRRKKKKKKFFENGTRPPRPEPGNSIAQQGGGQAKRKNRQRGPREFVGPMDHSYRVANGNIADGPASTIQITNGSGSNYHPDLFDSTPAPKVREDAPTRIFCFIEDLFFLAKIQETARKLGVKVEFLKGGDKETVTRLTGLGEAPRLLVFDLNNANAKPLTLIPKFKTKFKKATSVIGFLSHLQGDLKAKASEVGCDTVMPRSAFSQSLPNLLRRYGMDEEEEYIPQPV
jgi:hypothetical protein